MIIDAHVHVFPSVGGYTRGGFIKSGSDGMIYYGTGESVRWLPPSFRNNESSPELLLAYMDWQEVDHAVIMQSQFCGEWNDYLKEVVTKYPSRFTAIGSFDPYVKNASRHLEQVVFDKGYRTIKLECSANWGLGGVHTSLDYQDEEFHVLWKLADKQGLTVVIDTGSVGNPFIHRFKLGDIAQKYKNLKLIIAHLGFPPEKENEEERTEWKKYIELGKLDNVWFDIANILAWANDEYPFVVTQKNIKMAYEVIGAKKIIFGTDYPNVLTKSTYSQAFKYLTNHCEFLSKEDLQHIMADNAIHVYNIRI